MSEHLVFPIHSFALQWKEEHLEDKVKRMTQAAAFQGKNIAIRNIPDKQKINFVQENCNSTGHVRAERIYLDWGSLTQQT